MTIDDISATLSRLNKFKIKVYICGPPKMIECVANSVMECSIQENSIYYEKWW